MNEVIRNEARRRRVFLWEIAARLGLNDGNLSRKLRRELTAQESEQILTLIKEIADEREGTV